jgi:hypothetical protein
LDRYLLPAEREAALRAFVEDQLGDHREMVTAQRGQLDLLTRELWLSAQVRTIADVDSVPVFASAMAIEALEAAWRDVAVCDLPSAFTDMRQAFERQVLALAALFEPDIGRSWLAAKELPPWRLRQVVKKHEKAAASVVDDLYGHLSNVAHGRPEAALAYFEPSG